MLAEIGKKEGPEMVERALVRLRKALTLFSSKKGEGLVAEISIYIYRAKKLLWYMHYEAMKETRKRVAQEFRQYVDQDPSLDTAEKERRLQSYMECHTQGCGFAIPDHLICQITYELMEDPVLTEAGLTYERQAIQEHIEKNGATDPITRKPISPKLYPNIAVRKAVKDFLDNNPWAYEYS